jgi:hypothetical protein
VITFPGLKPASYLIVAQYTKSGEGKRESAAAQEIVRTWNGRDERGETPEGRREEQ